MLADPNTLFDQRIDFVFYRGAGFVPVGADVLDMRLDRTEGPLWASDHAAVAVDFQIKRAPFVRGRH